MRILRYLLEGTLSGYNSENIVIKFSREFIVTPQ